MAEAPEGPERLTTSDPPFCWYGHPMIRVLVSLVAAGLLSFVIGCDSGGGGDVCDHIIDKGFEGVDYRATCEAFVADLRGECSNGDAVLECIGRAEDRDAYGACEDLCQ